jgi:hypothetical protein
MFNTLERALLMRKLSQNSDRIKRLESLLQGQPLSVVKIADASITEAKIGSLAVSKLTTGQLAVGTLFDIGDVAGGDYIRKSGTDLRILMYKGGVPQLVIGMQTGTPVIKIAKDGVNALTETDPNEFVFYVDQLNDYTLIKEKVRGSVSVNGTQNVAHGLGYIPLCLVFCEISAGVFRKVFGPNYDGTGIYFKVDGTNLVLVNTTGGALNFYYYIFYDEVD